MPVQNGSKAFITSPSTPPTISSLDIVRRCNCATTLGEIKSYRSSSKSSANNITHRYFNHLNHDNMTSLAVLSLSIGFLKISYANATE